MEEEYLIRGLGWERVVKDLQENAMLLYGKDKNYIRKGITKLLSEITNFKLVRSVL